MDSILHMGQGSLSAEQLLSAREKCFFNKILNRRLFTICGARHHGDASRSRGRIADEFLNPLEKSFFNEICETRIFHGVEPSDKPLDTSRGHTFSGLDAEALLDSSEKIYFNTLLKRDIFRLGRAREGQRLEEMDASRLLSGKEKRFFNAVLGKELFAERSAPREKSPRQDAEASQARAANNGDRRSSMPGRALRQTVQPQALRCRTRF